MMHWEGSPVVQSCKKEQRLARTFFCTLPVASPVVLLPGQIYSFPAFHSEDISSTMEYHTRSIPRISNHFLYMNDSPVHHDYIYIHQYNTCTPLRTESPFLLPFRPRGREVLLFFLLEEKGGLGMEGKGREDGGSGLDRRWRLLHGWIVGSNLVVIGWVVKCH